MYNFKLVWNSCFRDLLKSRGFLFALSNQNHWKFWRQRGVEILSRVVSAKTTGSFIVYKRDFERKLWLMSQAEKESVLHYARWRKNTPQGVFLRIPVCLFCWLRLLLCTAAVSAKTKPKSKKKPHRINIYFELLMLEVNVWNFYVLEAGANLERLQDFPRINWINFHRRNYSLGLWDMWRLKPLFVNMNIWNIFWTTLTV